jgi:uncharacterized protein
MPTHNRARRLLWAALAYVFVALALVGIVLPGVPTTPFVLLAAWAADRGSKRVHDWLTRHPRLGPPLADWREQGAVSTRAKVIAIAFLALSWIIMYVRATPHWLLAALAILFICVATFVATRPRPRA